ncbi:unnamed protein product, partial [Ectocarpus sp. 12 AP-2014]
DEIEAYRSVRYISASEAMWHIFGFRTQARTPSVNLLYVHLPNEQPVIDDEADSVEDRIIKADSALSDLMRYFGRPAFDEFKSLTFLQCFEQYSIEQDQRTAKRRKTVRRNHNNDSDNDDDAVTDHTECIRDRYRNYIYEKTTSNVSRIQYMSPDYGEVWYLRLLLLHRPAYSFTALKTVDGTIFETYQLCATHLGLVHDVNEYLISIQEAAQFCTPKELCRLFVTLILHGAQANTLWSHFDFDMSLDYAVSLSTEASHQKAIQDIDLILNKYGRNTKQFGLPSVKHDSTEYDRLINAFSVPEMIKLSQQVVPKLTREQKDVFDTMTNASITNKGGVFMIDALAGTGKSFTECAIAAHLRAQGKLVLCAASTGIAALILPGGLTAHSTFKLPFGDAAVEGSVCSVEAESERAHALKNASLITWDEIVMSGKYSPEALNLTLKDLLKNDRPFGGKCVLMSGDWRQVAPVLKFGTPSEIVEHAFLSSHLWQHVKRFRLTTSMRDKEDLPYAQTVLAIGEG